MNKLISLFFAIIYTYIFIGIIYFNTNLTSPEIYKFYDLLDLKIININILFFTLFVLSLSIHYSLFKRFSPRYRVYIANKLIKNIRMKNLNSAQLLSYLRKIDPFVFEELLLSLFKERKIKIKRNKRYTGDGGSDGKIWINSKKCHIQAKRYNSYINKSHMQEFIDLTQRDKSLGIFIHTGKTGRETKELAKLNNIEIISGEKLYNLFYGKKINLFNKEI